MIKRTSQKNTGLTIISPVFLMLYVPSCKLKLINTYPIEYKEKMNYRFNRLPTYRSKSLADVEL